MVRARHERGARPGRRRLLALNHFANPPAAPGGTRMVELTGRLEGWDTLVVAADRNLFTRSVVRIARPGYHTVRTLPYDRNGPARIANWASYALGAAAVGLRVERPDVVLASSPHLLTGLAGWVVATCRRAPFVLEVRDLWPQVLVDTARLSERSPTYRALAAVEAFLYRRADAVVVLSDGVLDHLAARGVPAGSLHLIPNGADPDDLVPRRDRDEVREALGWDGVVAVYAGAHGPANGLDAVLDAAPVLATTHPEVHLVLLGDGVDKPRLAARAEREGLANVTFLDPVPKQDMADLLGAADLGLHVLADVPLFRYGVSPNKLFDYLAAGLPVVTNCEGVVADVVGAAHAGVAVAPGALAEGIGAAVDAGSGARARWAADGRSWMAAHRTRAQMAARLQATLDGVVAQRAAGSTTSR